MGIFNFNRKEQKVEQPKRKSINELTYIENLNRYSFASLSNSTSGFVDNSYNFNLPNQNEPIQRNYEWVLFGPDNLHPNRLNELYYSSPMHSSIINFKRLNVIGNGYSVKPKRNDLSQLELINIDQFKHLFSEQLLSNLTMDYLIHSRLCFKVKWNNDFTKVIDIIRVNPEQVRNAHSSNGYYLSSNWGSKGLKGNKPEYIPAFDIKNRDCKEQLFVYQDYSPNLSYYVLPVYTTASNWLYLDGQISYFHKQNINNSVNPSVVIKVYHRPESDEEAEVFKSDLEQKAMGAKNAGKPFVIMWDDKETAPDIDHFESNALDKSFVVTQDMIVKNICISHSIDPVIMGIASQGALGQSQQLQTSYNMFCNSFVKPTQRIIENILSKFAVINKVQADFVCNYYNVLQKADDGIFEPDVTQSIISVVTNTQLTPEQKLQSLQILFGLSQDKAIKLINGK